jgi:FkbM family methyltransferase
MALATKASRVLAIEPHGESRQYLQKTILANGGTNVTVAAVAASDFTGTLKLYKNSENKGDNRIYPDPLLGESESIAADTIDNICERHGIHSIQFLKIDIQGAEAKAIAGASNLLNNSADCILMTEFWPYGIRHSDGNPGNYLESLKRHGFTLYELYKNRILPMDSPESLVSRNPGRKYTNLIGLKGRFTDIISL